ncbi:hypothetical protein Tco_1284447 [Tanacetum coccineum]
MHGVAGVQILENNLDDLHSSREEDGTSETLDPQDLLGSFLLADTDLRTVDLLTGTLVLDFLEEKKERSLDNNSYVEEYECSSLALD